jgi:uncharacterized protein
MDEVREQIRAITDPRYGEAGLRSLVERYSIKGVKLYTTEWRGSPKGYKLSDAPGAALSRERIIHVHKGPTIRPLNRDGL